MTGSGCGNMLREKKPGIDLSMSTHTDTTSPSVTDRLELTTLTGTAETKMGDTTAISYQHNVVAGCNIDALTTVNWSRKQLRTQAYQAHSTEEKHFCKEQKINFCDCATIITANLIVSNGRK